MTVDTTRRAVLTCRIRFLVAATIGYNVIEAVVALTAGTIASSTALIGFGLDSVIEVASATAVAWQFAGRDPETRERTALRIIAISFFALAAYVTVESVRALLGHGEAGHSTIGLVLAAVSLAVMPGLSYAQRRAGRELASATAVADSKQTLLCTYLSAVLLAGLALNSLFGWSWADPAAALVIAALAVKEGREAWRGDNCCAPGPLPEVSGACADGCCNVSLTPRMGHPRGLGGAGQAYSAQVQQHGQADTDHKGNVRDVADEEAEVVDEVDDMATCRPRLTEHAVEQVCSRSSEDQAQRHHPGAGPGPNSDDADGDHRGGGDDGENPGEPLGEGERGTGVVGEV
ncbi:hypothetical protein BJ964_006027 [Actinoplanes lobatus]|nr:hypothetical protein [Actinoplanes lobatus]